jgi:polyhydroxybutyrate depolymerase
MYRRDFHHQRAYRTKRLIAWICIAFLLLLVIGVFVYSLQAGLVPGLGGRHITLPGLPPLKQASNNANANADTGTDASCASQQPGQRIIYINSDGERRSFVIYVPTGYKQSLPLVLNYHGYDNTATNMAAYTDMGVEADKENFLIVFPQGDPDNASPPKPSWNAGIGDAGPTGTADDVQFTRDIISYVETHYCIDAHRIYATGYSIGGSMAYRVACDLSNQIAAFSSVEGAFYHIPGGCQASRPIPFLEIHSLVDPLAPYDGEGAKLPVQTILNLWFSIDQCNTSDQQTIFQQADVTGYEWPSCANGTVVEQYQISDGGHVWPGSATPQPSLGYTTQTIDANTVIWNFFSQFHT